MKILIKLLLAPFSIIFFLLTSLRNHLFNIGYTKSFTFDATIIGVGNLAVGGSGKTPMVEYILRLLLAHQVQSATLSRGYKRRTKGYRMASDQDNALTLGDEPYQLYLKFGKKAAIAVGEERALAIPHILFDRPETKAIVLDDAFQHRYVTPALNILLTDYSKPFYDDMIMPLGRLRESRKGAKRADVVVVTKCPDNLQQEDMSELQKRIMQYVRGNTPVLFSKIYYETPKKVYPHIKEVFNQNIVLLSGIANTGPLKKYVSENFNLLGTIDFPDHHFYTDRDVNDIAERFDRIDGDNKTLLTTEKDMVKLVNLQQKDRLESLSFYYLPITIGFIENGDFFNKMILEVVDRPLGSINVN